VNNNEEDVYKLLYFSSATDLLIVSELEQLVRKSADYNRSRGITGMLFYKSGLFAQVLEGEKEVIESLYENKISKDPRHYNSEIVVSAYDDKRCFSHWAMNFNNFNKAPFFTEDELKNDSKLGLIKILNEFDHAND